MMMSTNRIAQLSTLIARNTALIDDYFVKNKQPSPSLEADALPELPIADDAVDIKAARSAVIEACAELKALLTGPKEMLSFNWTAYVSVKAILRFKLDQSFAVDETTTFAGMSEFSGLDENIVKRLVRHAIINHRYFQENAPDVISHSALTAVLVNDPMARNRLVVALDEFWPAGVMMADAMEKWPNSEENNETGFALANNSETGMFDFFAAHPDRAASFGKLFQGPDSSTEEVVNEYPWADKKTMVDVGGSHGSVAIAIAERFPNMTCTVQDLPDTVANGESQLPEQLRDRVKYMAHDFFTPQPVTADVYYFRSIFHNWADKYCVKILQNLIPALRSGARIIIHERVLPDIGNLKTVEALRAINQDVGMQQLLNAKERELSEWQELIEGTDPRFCYIGARHFPGSDRWIIEAEWTC
ncbi:S-adenosyl-L-methionine-dependent methyltransferase [Xylariaceae sp. FL1272]|nr:S-adenosyl-L-methionine-dependent methyltransferase [Xylariaceae sp. FL1272]